MLFSLVIIVGDQGVGKTKILKKFINKPKQGSPQKESATVGVELNSKEVQINGREKVKLQIWDTAGQERYRSITSAYYRRAVGAIIVYDITDKKSFDNLNKWIQEIKYYGDEDIQILIIGNKIDQDINRQVDASAAEELAYKGSYLYKETSAVFDDQGISDAFISLIQKINEKQKEKQQIISEQRKQENINLNQNQQEDLENKPCC